MTRLFPAIAVAATMGCSGVAAPDLVVVNARVFTNDIARPWAEALAVRRDRVVGIGTRQLIEAVAGPATKVVDAGGRVVVPGFNDARVDLPLATVSWDRLPSIVRWAYGAEDPLVMSGGVGDWRDALEQQGVPQVWQRKRPRLDSCTPVFQRDVAALARLGVVVVFVPCSVVRVDTPPEATAGSLADAGIGLAAGSAGPPDPMGALSTLLALAVRTGLNVAQGTGRALTREEAVRGMTWGSAYAEKAERDKGWLGPGTLADIAVLSDDVFTAPADRLSAITSVLTLVGGAIVYDPGILSARP